MIQVFSQRARRPAGAVLARTLVFLVAVFAALALQLGSAMAEPPGITPAPGALPAGVIGQHYEQAFVPVWGASPYSYFLNAPPPPGMAFDAELGVLTGTPTTTGSFNITVNTRDEAEDLESFDYTWVIGLATVAITSQPESTSITEGASGNLFSVAADNATTYQWQISSDGGDTWALLDGEIFDGRTSNELSIVNAPLWISGYKFRVKIEGNGGPIYSHTATLTVTAGQPTVAITTQPVNNTVNAGMTGELFRVVASNATGYLWQFRLNSGDTWREILSNASGQTTEALSANNTPSGGSGQFRVTVFGNGGPVYSDIVTLTVNPAQPATMSISPSPGALPRGTVGVAYSQTFTVTGGKAPYQFVLSGDLPPGMHLDPDSGILSGTPTVATTFSSRVSVSDDNETVAHFDYTWLVGETPDFDADEVAREVDKLAQGFVRSRQGLVARSATVPGLRERRNGASDPVTTSMTPSDNGFVMGFAASTAQVEAVRQIDGVTSPSYAAPFNIWIDGTIAATTGNDSGDRWGSFAMVSVGADYLVSEKVLLGLSLHYDRMTDPTDGNAEITGNGWLAGPYASVELDTGVFWDTQLLYGGSSNAIDMGAWSGGFDSQRWLFDTSIAGRWNLDDATVLTPKLRAVYLSEQVDGYAVENGAGDLVDVDGFTQQQLRASLGAAIEHRIAFDNGMTLVPKLGGQVGYAGLGGAGLFGSASTGISLEATDDWALDTSLSLSIEGDGQKSAATRLGVSGRF